MFKAIKSGDFYTSLLSLGAPERKKFEGFIHLSSDQIQ